MGSKGSLFTENNCLPSLSCTKNCMSAHTHTHTHTHTQTSGTSRSSVNAIHSDLLSQTESFLEELRVRQETQRREEEEAERQRKIREERERREREVRDTFLSMYKCLYCSGIDPLPLLRN